MRCLLHSANLGPEYWSFALTHAVYLKNRLPHAATGETPHLSYTGYKPNATHLRVFGCPVFVKNPGRRPYKLDLHTATGRFLGYTATNKNIIYIDDVTKRIKIATHCVFDEAGVTLPPLEQSTAQQALQKAGYKPDPAITHNDVTEAVIGNDTTEHLIVKLLSQNAKTPQKGTPGAAGYDVFSAVTASLQPGQRGLFPLDIQLTPPQGTYIQMKSRSGISVKNIVDVQAGVIDADFTGNVTVVLHNHGTETFHVNIGDKIAQIVIIKIETPDIHMTTAEAQSTQRGENGFGSTGVHTQAVAASLNDQNTNEITELPYHIYISDDPFDQCLDITIPIKGDHPTLGLKLIQCKH